MIKTLLLSFLSVLTFFSVDVYAKRVPPPEVKPIEKDGIQYTAHFEPLNDDHQARAFVQASDLKTNKELWQTTVYKITYNPKLERDVQDVYISSMEMRDNSLVVVNEKKQSFRIDLKTHEVQPIKPEKH